MKKMLLVVLAALSVLAGVKTVEAVQATLNWTNPSDPNRTAIRVFRRDGVDANPFVQQGSDLTPAVTTFNQPGLVLSTRYCYRVDTVGALGSNPSSIVCGTPDAPLSVNGLTIIFAP